MSVSLPVRHKPLKKLRLVMLNVLLWLSAVGTIIPLHLQTPTFTFADDLGEVVAEHPVGSYLLCCLQKYDWALADYGGPMLADP